MGSVMFSVMLTTNKCMGADVSIVLDIWRAGKHNMLPGDVHDITNYARKNVIARSSRNTSWCFKPLTGILTPSRSISRK